MILRRQMPLSAQEHRPIWQADLAAGQSLKDASYHYLVTDHLGVPVLALNKAGETTWKARYEAFGKARIDNASTAQINLRLPGQYFDAETGLHQNWNRDYAPGIGRYVQADPLGIFGGMNVYQYAYGNPMVYMDTEGRYGILGFLGGVGVNLSFQVVGAMIQGVSITTALKCINVTDIIVSGAIGALGSTFLSQIILRKPGNFAMNAFRKEVFKESTTAIRWMYESSEYFTRSIPAGFAIKKAMPDMRIGGDDCECEKYSFGGLLGEIFIKF